MTPHNPYDQLLVTAGGKATKVVLKRLPAQEPPKCLVHGCSEPRILQSNGYHRGMCRQHYNLYQNQFYAKKSDSRNKVKTT